MLAEKDVSIFDFVHAISETMDLAYPTLNNHHHKVAYMSRQIAQIMDLSSEETQDIILAAMLHDIGEFSLMQEFKWTTYEAYDDDIDNHAVAGYKLLKNFEPLGGVAELIMHHHAEYDKSGHDVPMGSYVIHLADRLSILLDDYPETGPEEVCEAIYRKQGMFHPETLAALDKLANLEYVWIEFFSLPVIPDFLKNAIFTKRIIDLDTLHSFAKTLARIIDFKSRFTATHSSGVAAVAHELAALSGFSERECKQMEIAGLLHDLGKLAVPNKILEKNGPLSENEMSHVKKHAYYTYAVLSKIGGLEHIATLAAHHHERHDGNGYPFHVKGDDFPKLERIMAVADIVTALMEDRPYRAGMSKEGAMKVLLFMVETGGIDRYVVQLLKDNFLRINEVRIKAQRDAMREYESFHSSIMASSYAMAG